MRTGRFDGSKLVIGATPDRPATRFVQSSAAVRPSGVTAPTPVTTTRGDLMVGPSPDWISSIGAGPSDLPVIRPRRRPRASRAAARAGRASRPRRLARAPPRTLPVLTPPRADRYRGSPARPA